MAGRTNDVLTSVVVLTPFFHQDRPDLVVSELAGLAFDSLQQAFRPGDLDVMFSQKPPEERNTEPIYIAIDPAAGGPQSDYAMVSITRHKGMITVRAVCSWLLSRCRSL